MFTTPSFVIYLILVILLFFCVRREWRVSVLAFASILYCFSMDVYAGVILVFLSLVNFAGGHGIEWLQKGDLRRGAKSLTVLLVSLDIVLIFVYKFGIYFLQRIGYLEKINQNLIEYLIMPLGLSFYTFQAVSYLVDIYKNKYQAKENLMEFMLYMSFFPKFVSGPIERSEDFFSQLKKIKDINFWQSGRLSISFTYILYGYFMKIVIADRVAVIVNKIFDYPQGYDSLWLLMGMILYTIQIYADFAGYSYIAVGVAKIFGIELQMNFKNPYFAVSISEFWRKWHISLSSWLRDYLYIPLGGNQKGKARKNINTVIVFIICGLWHGTGISFLIWGILHGLFSIIDSWLTAVIRKKSLRRCITMVEVTVAWVFFRASSTKGAINYFWQMLMQGSNWNRITENFWKLGLTYVEIGVIIICSVMMLLVDGWSAKQEGIFPEVLQKKSRGIRYFAFYALLIIVFIFGIYGTGYHSESFIYMQF